VLLAIPVGVWYVKFMTEASLNAQIKALKPEWEMNAETIKRNEQLKKDEATLAAKLTVLDEMITKQSLWIKVLEAISFSQSRSRDLWLTQITTKQMAGMDAGKIEVTIMGMSFSAASVDEFVRSLKKSDINPDVKVPNFNPATVGDQNVLKFVMSFTFRA
jgi:Tfp pilus assembly protein PilN